MRGFRGAKNWAAARWGLQRFHRDEGGAILLLGLAAVMILMLLAWVLYDSGQMGRHKLNVQAAADTAAYSQAAVNARVMNNLAYANIAKRSVVGIHSQYAALWEAYDEWFQGKVAACAAGDDNACRVVQENREIHDNEKAQDFATYRDDLSSGYYLQDVIAIDSYQRYTHALAPWWGWSEAVLRAARNGAGMAASFPVPRGQDPRRPILNTITDRVIDEVGWRPLMKYTGRLPWLPVSTATDQAQLPGYYRHMLEEGMGPDLSFFKHEYGVNTSLHKDASENGAASQAVIASARTKFDEKVIDDARAIFGVYGAPWRLFRTTNRAQWSTWTSNLVMTYRRKEELFGEMRQKYDPVNSDYTLEDEEKYRRKGYWGMARAEISFQGGHRAPDLWHPRWTARLRPVALPNEFQEAGLKMSAIYHDMLPYFALSGIVTTGDPQVVRDSFDDLVFMERANRALGHSTVEGVAK